MLIKELISFLYENVEASDAPTLAVSLWNQRRAWERFQAKKGLEVYNEIGVWLHYVPSITSYDEFVRCVEATRFSDAVHMSTSTNLPSYVQLSSKRQTWRKLCRKTVG